MSKFTGKEQQKIARLQEALSRNELAHALLLEIPEISISKLEPFFKNFLCQKQGVAACGVCDSCLVSLDVTSHLLKGERHHPDFWIVKPENESGYSVDQVRLWEAQFLYLSKNMAPKKLLVITQAEKLLGTQNSAANALLKILEEPRPHTHLILLSATPLRLISTIRSRCLKVNLRSEFKAEKLELSAELREILQALEGKFSSKSQLSTPSWWKERAERISLLETNIPLLWKEASSKISGLSREEALRVWTSWKHYEDFLSAVKHYGNPSLHWLNFKRKVLGGQPWRISKLFG